MKNLAGIETENNFDYKTVLTEICERQYQSKVYSNGEFDYCHCIDICENSDTDNKYIVFWGIAKTKKYIPKKQLKSVLACSGITQKECSTFDIYNYGLSASIDSIEIDENEIDEVLTNIASRIDCVNSLIGFYLDRQVNMIGNNGWNSLDGNIGLK